MKIFSCSPSQVHAINEIALTTLLLHALYPQHFTFQWKLLASLVYIMVFAYRAKQLNYTCTRTDSFRYAKQRKGGRVRSFGGFTWLPIAKKSVQFIFQEARNFFPVLAKWNMIHVNNFGCLARDLNLTVFSIVIFLSTLKRRFPSAFYNIGRSIQSCWSCYFGFIQVNVNIEIRQALIVAVH